MIRVDLHKLPIINKNAIPWIIWSVAGLFYFFEIILRMLPGTMANHLMQVFRINATELGVFTAFYYWSYTLMQVPAGLIVDRFDIRKTIFFACLLCLTGFGMVHISNNLHLAELGRFVLGFGSAFAYVSALKVASIWLPKKRFGLASCIVDSLGMIGAMFAEIVLVRINIESGYRYSVFFLIATGLIVALLVLLFVQSPPDSKSKLHKTVSINDSNRVPVLRKITYIIKNPQIWLIGIVGCLFYLPSSVIGDVWGIPYLHQVYHLSRQESSDLLAAFFAGWTLIGPFLGALSDKIQRRVLPIKLTIILDAVLFSIVIFSPLFSKHLLPVSALFVLFFFIGVSTGTHPLVFAIAKENFPNKIAGTVVAVTNTLIMIGGILFQPLVGFLLDLSHHSLFKAGIEHYTAYNFTIALSIIPIALITSLVIMFFVKETGYKLAENDQDDDLEDLRAAA